MIIPVRCFTCGRSFDLAYIFKEHMSKLIQTQIGETEPRYVNSDITMNIDLSNLFNKLQIKNDCCRCHISTALSFTDYYH
ncbi:RNA polymerases N / 8 kDa subunit [uncultured archaeon]|nr:RNA polymerases N / 8 kDa subunit [uncultured archaeon]